MKSLISVIIPTYNRSNKIIRAVKSVLCQTYDNVEIIIIDDYSTDDTQNIIKNFIDTNNLSNTIRYVKNENNIGNAAARNVGIKLIKGEFVAFLDDDDFWLPDKLQKQINLILEKKAKFVSCGTIWFEENNFLKVNISDSKKRGSFEKGGPTSTWLLHKSVFDKIGNFDERFPSAVDGEFLVRLNKNFDVYFVQDYLYVHFYYKEQISSSNDKKIKGFELLLDKHKNIFKNYELSSLYFKLAIFHIFNNKRKFGYIVKSIQLKPKLRNMLIFLICLLPMVLTKKILNKYLDFKKYPRSFAGRYGDKN